MKLAEFGAEPLAEFGAEPLAELGVQPHDRKAACRAEKARRRHGDLGAEPPFKK